ncbi:hypothetical protein BCR39DRAFT_550489 [Naematelia encephala]|uniref:Uncharacterized protein n=1 Tax=Naematelia encephala TaxID=71784 RepID=A0A1Y2AKY4_9TREE|nr:hypothetical protein BCR39DRAFT_550489 [Naematelia encephala]
MFHFLTLDLSLVAIELPALRPSMALSSGLVDLVLVSLQFSTHCYSIMTMLHEMPAKDPVFAVSTVRINVNAHQSRVASFALNIRLQTITALLFRSIQVEVSHLAP